MNNLSNFQILSYNCQKSHTVLHSLLNNPLASSFTILALQEPPIIRATGLIRQNYPQWDLQAPKLLPSHTITPNTPPRTCFFINKNHAKSLSQVTVIPLTTTDLTLLSFQYMKGPTNYILNVYNPPQSFSSIPLIKPILRATQNHPTHIMGDFNCHHPLWNNSNRTNLPEPAANRLVDMLTLHNFQLISPKGIPTHKSGTTIDLYFVNNKVNLGLFTTCKINTNLESSSDHFPIHLCIPTDQNVPEAIPRRNLKQADWKKGRRILKHLEDIDPLPKFNKNIHNPKEWLDDLTSKLIKRIQKAIAECAPILKINYHTKRWWSKDLVTLRKEQNHLLKRFQRTRWPPYEEAYDLKQSEYKRAIKYAQAKQWDNFLENIEPQQIHIAAKYVKGFRSSTPFLPHFKKEDGSYTSTEDEQAQVLYEKLLGGNENSNSTQREMPTSATFLPIESSEMDYAFRKMKDKKAPGPDGIPVQAIKEFKHQIQDYLAYIAQASMHFGYYPQAFKEATCIVIPKPGKPFYDEPKAYRPISLLNHMSKIIESIMTRRLQYQLQKQNTLPQQHFGCRKNSGTDDALTKLSTIIHNAWKKKEVVAALALDAQGAFDNVIHSSLIEHCKKAKLSKCLISWISGFLSNRRVKFSLSGKLSRSFNLNKGSPQGSPISGPLYLLYNKAMLDGQQHIIKMAYADDILWLSRGITVRIARERIEKEIPKADEWSKSHSTPLDLAKTKYIVFTRDNFKIDKTPLQWNENTIQISDAIKYLGLIFDSRLSFKQATNKLTQRGMSSLMSLIRLVNTRKGINVKKFFTLYQTHVCSTTDYAGHVWIKYQSKNSTAMKTLNNIHKIAIRKGLGAYRTTPLTSLIFDSGLLTPEERLRAQAERYLIKTASRKEGHLAREAILETACKPTKRFISQTQYSIGKICNKVDLKKIETIDALPQAPWRKPPFIIPKIPDPERAKQIHDQLLKDWENPKKWYYYSDGSLSNGIVAAATVSPTAQETTIEQACRLGNSATYSIYDAEMMGIWLAMYNAFKRIKSMHFNQSPDTINIFCDNQSVIEAIRTFHVGNKAQYIMSRIIQIRDRLYHSLNTNHIKVWILWLPSHSGITGNEKADNIANKARTQQLNCLIRPEHIYDLSNGIDQLDFELVPSLSAISQNFKQQHTKRLKTISRQPQEGVSARVQNLRGLKTPQTVFKFLSQLPRRVCAMAVQLKSGHFPTKSYLYKFKHTHTDKCTECNVRDDIYHRLHTCRKYIKQRQELIHKLKNLKCPFHLKNILQRKDGLIETCKFLQQQEYKTN